MIVFDLRCARDHVFEIWFGSSSDFEDQRDRALVACPICGNTEVAKAVMAPNVARKGNRTAAGQQPAPPAEVKQAIAALAAAQSKALEASEWVGRNFASRARAIHDGDDRAQTIHGQTTRAEAKALIEDGVPIAPLPFPVIPPNARN